MSSPNSAAPAVTELDEGFLTDLGIHRLASPVPFPEAGGPVNAYALEETGGTYTLFDTGVGTQEGIAALEARLAAQGLSPSRLSRIVVSHGHEDHYDNAQRLAEASGAPVLLHRDDLEKVAGDNRWHVLLQKHLGFYRRQGVPEATLAEMVAAADHGKVFARQVEPERVRLVDEGEVLHFRHFSAKLLHLPGHTPGLLCLHAEAEQILLADDHLLARVSPNPLLDFVKGEGSEKFRSLARYLDSARRVYALDLKAVLPGHGPAFFGHRPLLDGLYAFYGRRQQKVLARLAQAPSTAFELVPAIFPRWTAGLLFLMLAEVVGALEVLEDAGQVARTEGDVTTFRLA